MFCGVNVDPGQYSIHKTRSVSLGPRQMLKDTNAVSMQNFQMEVRSYTAQQFSRQTFALSSLPFNKTN